MVEGHPGVWVTQALGRVYTVHLSNSECFYLCMLLHVFRGPTSLTDLKTVNGVMCETYREACDRLGLLESDTHWDSVLAEAMASQLPHRVRHLFAILLITCAVSNPLQLWDKYQKDMSEDILHTLRIQHPGLSLDFSENICNRALQLLEDMRLSMSGKSLQLLGLPSPTRELPTNQLCAEILRETNYSIEELALHVSLNEPLLVQTKERLIMLSYIT